MSSRFRSLARSALARWSAAAAQYAWAADAGPAESRATVDQLYQQVLADPTNVELNLRYAAMAAKRSEFTSQSRNSPNAQSPRVIQRPGPTAGMGVTIGH
jgi:hypothetical protein